jgi:hypothetical protein
MHYRHAQTGTFIISGMAFVFVMLFVIPLPMPLFALAIAVVMLFTAMFYRLTVEIQSDVLTCSFGIGLIRRNIPLTDIEQALSVKNPWLMGWGIRWLPGRYWLWNVSGLLAVELTMTNGKRFRIGTDEPEKLVNAIESAKTMYA